MRVLVDEFEPSGNLRRVLKDNADLIGQALPNRPTSEQYSLFRRYLDPRHADGGMADMTVLDYSMMVEDSHVDTKVDRVPPARHRQRHHRQGDRAT